VICSDYRTAKAEWQDLEGAGVFRTIPSQALNDVVTATQMELEKKRPAGAGKWLARMAG